LSAGESSPVGRACAGRLRQVLRQRSFWILAAMMLGLAAIHYLTPQIRLLPFLTDPLGRHAVERIAFLLPVAAATFAFGRGGGISALTLSLLIMMPRALFVSPYPIDASSETVAVAIVGYLVVGMIETQEREKRLRQEAVQRLRAANAVTAMLTKSLDRREMLDGVLERTLDVVGAAAGCIYLVEAGHGAPVLTLAVGHGALPDVLQEGGAVGLGDGPIGRAAEVGEVVAVSAGDSQQVEVLEGWVGMNSLLAVPLKSRDEVLGVLVLADPERRFESQDVELLMAIGGEIGVALENARLYESMRFYVGQVTRAQEDERKRIARELHDETTQDLIALSRRLEALNDEGEGLSNAVRKRLAGLQELVEEALRGVRRFSQNLRPSALDDLGLLAALEGMAAVQREESGVATELRVEGQKRRLPPEVELTLFRIAQEALSNVRRHAQSARIAITVRFGDGDVELIVEDDGKGFSVPARLSDMATLGKLGLVGMLERARLLGGSLAVESSPGQGTRVVVRVAVQQS